MEIIKFINIGNLLSWKHGLQLKELYVSVAVSPSTVRVPSQQSIAPSITSVTYVGTWSVHILPSDWVKSQKTSVKIPPVKGSATFKWHWYNCTRASYNIIEYESLKFTNCVDQNEGMNKTICTSLKILYDIKVNVGKFCFWELPNVNRKIRRKCRTM